MANSRKNSYVVVLVTCGSRRQAGRIARAVVSKKLAACVNILESPVRSVYRWKKKVEQADEILLIIKTSRRRLPALQRAVKTLHSYDVPEFIAIPIVAGSPSYLAWMSGALHDAG